MPRNIRLISILMALILLSFSLFSCGEKEEANDETRSFETSAGSLVFNVPPKEKQTGEGWESELKSCADVFENAYELLMNTETGLLSEINAEVNSVLDCNESEIELYKTVADKAASVGINVSVGGTITFEGTSVLKSDPAAKLDYSGVSADYALGVLCDTLKDLDYTSGYVSIGNTFAVIGQKEDGTAYNIGIQKSSKSEDGEYYGYIRITDGFVSMTENEETKSKTIVYSADQYVSHVYADKLSVMTTDEVNAFYSESETRFEAVVISSDGKITKTEGLEKTSIFYEDTTIVTEK